MVVIYAVYFFIHRLLLLYKVPLAREETSWYTANILKHLEINGKGYQLVLRIRTDSDPEEFQNSVITFMSVNEKRYRQYLRNRKILYSRE